VKRGSFCEREKNLLHRMEHEHEFYKYKMLSKSREEIYNRCNEILFVECIYEYLSYAEDIPKEKLEALLKCKNNMYQCLYRVYLANEYTSVSTWKDIENLLDELINEQRNWNELLEN